jgi:NADH-quinone oxidoreductase subunit N
MDLLRLIAPELILIGTACALFLLGVSNKAPARRAAPVVALLALLAALIVELARGPVDGAQADPFGAFRITAFTQYIRLLAVGVSVMFVLMSWPSDRAATGNSALNFGTEAGEFFALMLLSVAGVLLVAGADDMILLFLGLELASIPTYIMVSISRPLAVAQEAGVKYFFLGAMSAAVMLFGFSYLYGTTGTTSLRTVTEMFAATLPGGGAAVRMTPWQMLAVLMLIAGFAFKIAAVPLHVYVGDVYQGAATPLTAMLSFVPKTSGMVALIKLLFVAGGGAFAVPETISKLLWILAALTMTVGNVLGLIQIVNVKRVLAYSSVAHTGYMLVGIAAVTYAAQDGAPRLQEQALAGVLFYLAAYGLMNAAAFGVLMLLPARQDAYGTGRGIEDAGIATSAETYEDIAGQGRNHPGLGLAMAASCFSLIGLPLTVGFLGKLFLLMPALRGGLYWLVIIALINAAISAAYYLKIVATMFLRAEPSPSAAAAARPADAASAGALAYAGRRAALAPQSLPVLIAVTISTVGTVLFGSILPATQVLRNTISTATRVDEPVSPSAGATAAAVPSPTDAPSPSQD